jgi:hypothetical protein
MKPVLNAVIAALSYALGATAIAAATPDEIAKIGKEITPWGAEIAGSKDGTIPAYTGGLRTPPAGFKADGGGKRWIDPYASDKPVVQITAENFKQYEGKLLLSTVELFQRFPKSFRMDVYPTRRSVWVPDSVNEQSIKNASTAKVLPNGYGITGAYGGTPFPVPKTGAEVWWNYELRHRGVFHYNNVNNFMIDSTGRRSLTGQGEAWLYYPAFDQDIGRDKFLAGDQLYYKVLTGYTAPSSRVGESTLAFTWTDHEKNPARFWQYTPGTRRVRSAPDLFYDTPCPAFNGGITMDDIQMTYGPQDRFDWKLVGKREVYIPYNTNAMQFQTPSERITTANHPNPDVVRWELHRVWVLEGTPKKGVRHLYSKKVMYVDEDLGGAQMETYDQGGKLFRAGWTSMVHLYDIGVPYAFGSTFFDFSTGNWFLVSHPGDSNVKGLVFPNDASWRRKLDQFTPEAMQAAGIR